MEGGTMSSFWDERGKISEKQREDLYAKQHGKCMYCGRKKDIDDFHADHKTPISRGGSNRLSNFQLICGSCNTRKGKLTNAEFRRKYGLTPAAKAKTPPSKEIPQSHFKDIQKEKAKEQAKKKAKANKWIDF